MFTETARGTLKSYIPQKDVFDMFRSFSKSEIERGKGKLSSSISKVMLEGINKSLSWCYVMLEGCKREYLLTMPGLMYLPTPEW